MSTTINQRLTAIFLCIVMLFGMMPFANAEALAITKQPQNVYVAEGKTASTIVTATGEGLTYQWYYTANGSSSAFNKSSVTSATYSTQMTAERDGRQVYCVVKDATGTSVTSNTVTLGIAASVAITKQPTDVSVQENENASTSVTATGDGLTYQWYYTANGSSSTFNKSSTTSRTYTTQMTAARDGRKVYCVVTDSSGHSVTSKTVTLSIAPALAITQQPKDASAADGETVSTTVKATGDGLTYKWYWKNASDTSYLLSSVTSNTYTTPMSQVKDGRTVYCVITDASGNSVTSRTATLTLAAPALVITSQPKDASAADGETVSTTVKATGDGLTYKWYWKNASDSDYLLSSVTSNTYTTPMSAIKDGRTVYCVITDENG
ncbi:MAG: hypothetical protein E7326_04985, partial [Clostridiales bacterium]|nr:hypothetical protein [Clostridiales bacterium]